jgi:tRNA A37 threonylcarbamoyltransferase TsaD
MRFYRPEPALCTDNGAMIGAAAYYAFKKGRVSSLDLNAYATLPLDEIQSCCGAAGRPRGQFPDGSLPDR